MKRVLALVVAAVAGLSACKAEAGPDRLSILLGSRHIGATGFEEVNPGLWLTWDRAPFDWSIGAYRNSYGKATVAAAASLPVMEWRGGELALFAGVAHYPGDGRRMRASLGGDLIPIGGVQVRQGNFFAQLIPSDGRPVKAIVSFGLTFDLTRASGRVFSRARRQP